MPRKTKTSDPAPTDALETQALPQIAPEFEPEIALTSVDEQAPAHQSAASADYASPPARFESFEAFYPYYLTEHTQDWTRRLHVIGTGLAIASVALFAWSGIDDGLGYLVWAAIFGYGFAWAAHHFVEKNQPTTFTYPMWSLRGDFKMFWEVVTGKRAW